MIQKLESERAARLHSHYVLESNLEVRSVTKVLISVTIVLLLLC